MKQKIVYRQSFALVELLLVAAVAALLAALLPSVVHKAVERSLTEGCVGQLKQVAQIVQAYADDNRNMLPCAMKWDYATYERQPDVNTTQYAVNRMARYFRQIGEWEWKRWAGPDTDGWSSSTLLNCPAHTGEPKAGFFNRNHISDYQFNYRFSHAELGDAMRQNFYNGNDANPWAFKGPLGPSEVFTFRDYGFGAKNAGRHDNQGNVAYADGHVETVTALKQILNNGQTLKYDY